MKNNLLARFALILVVVALALLCLYKFPLRGGIDLAGGTSLLYEVQFPEGYTGDKAHMASEVIDVLKRRVDPLSQKNLIWRVVGGRRIQLQIPLADKASREARAQVRAAEQALRDAAVKPQDLADIAAKEGPEREALIKKIAAGWDVRETYLTRLGDSQSRINKLTAIAEKAKEAGKPVPFAVLDGLVKAEATFQADRAELFKTNVDVPLVKSLLESIGTGSADAKKKLDTLLEKSPAQRSQLKTLIDADARMAAFRDQNTEDAEDIQRLLRGAGKLDFRIAVSNINEAGVQEAIDSLDNLGPRKSIGSMRWFEVDKTGLDNFPLPGTSSQIQTVSRDWSGKRYVLLYTSPDKSLTHELASRKWKLADAAATSDPATGSLEVHFQLDPSGARYFGDMTGNNIDRPMAILLDDRAMQAPNISSRIDGNGRITFGKKSSGQALQDEVNNLVKILKAGSLSAALASEPISVQQIDASMGKDNVEKGFRSALIALIVVVCFMLLYYTITGSFADVALVINLLITLGVMALLGATFTLPGIAGLVLTLGMAVDANVLINERIREELHKGSSLWMAIKQGYDRVFWTIFDSNLTTALTSVVLILVGSEEVKGFGVTLMIGLFISMFTALFVTRTLMIAAVRWNILRAIDDHTVAEYIKEVFTFTWLRKGRWPFMKVITISNIDWISKRHYFWAFSAIISVAGLIVFIARGPDKYDTEFLGGTQVTFKTAQPMATDDVREIVQGMGRDPALLRDFKEFKELEQANVYGVSATDGKSSTFELQTTIADKSGAERSVKQRFLEALAQKFPNPGAVQKINVAGLDEDPRKRPSDAEILASMLDQGQKTAVPISHAELPRNFEGRFKELPAAPVANYNGGVAFYFKGISPPQTITALTQRLSATKQSLSAAARKFEIIGVNPAGEGKFDSVVLVASDDQISYSADNPNSGWDKVAEAELHAFLISLEPRSPFLAVNSIDAGVAGQAKMQALAAIFISLVLIVVYVWIRFGGIRFGYGAILSLAHDAIMALSATVLAKYVANTWFGQTLLITDFKINLTMIAAYLTVVGYSVNDTIVIFDRIRENRGRGNTPLTAKLVNDSINQCFGRTIWTTFTVFVVLLIMYIWGGEGVHGFSFAMLIGTITGVYSTLAIASPMLLSVKEKMPSPTPPKQPSLPGGPDGVADKAPAAA